MFSDTRVKVNAELTFNDEGEPAVTVTARGTKDYGDRPATVTVVIDDEKTLAAVSKALAGVLTDDLTAGIDKLAMEQAADSFSVATKKGEEV